ncbi:MAG: aminopeptidase P N-terminal domain-containing protein [Candidatus Aminicenantales bacterium]
MIRKRIPFCVCLLLVLGQSLAGALLFEKSEYAARRTKLMDRIPDGIAVILGAQPITGYNPYVQNNDFMYFSGVEIPDAILVVDGVNRESTLFFTIAERTAAGEGISLDLVRNPKEVTGIERVLPLEQFSSYLSRTAPRAKVLYTSFMPEELLRECSQEKSGTLLANTTLNPWDGRLTRELQFVKVLKDRFPGAEIKDCSPFIWSLRAVKSPAEIAVLRRSGRLGVQATIETMRASRAGLFEYELSAVFEYFCRKAGADIAYNVIISSDKNHPYLHYYKHDRKLADGDFLVVDAGPDVDFYDVDISFSFPANGKFTPRQREIYEACLAVQQANLERYRPGVTCEQIREEVNEVLTKRGFDLSKEIFKIRTMQAGCSHNVGMAVHDVSGGPRGPLQPGNVFACDIFAVFPGENLGVRIEDTVVITENGCENLTAGIPREIGAIEELMRTKGTVQLLKAGGIY